MYSTAVYLILIQTEGCCLIYAELKYVTQVKKVREMNERRKKSDELTAKKGNVNKMGRETGK
jgi:hypothetical protein